MYKGRSAPVILGEVNPGCMRGGHMVFKSYDYLKALEMATFGNA